MQPIYRKYNEIGGDVNKVVENDLICIQNANHKKKLLTEHYLVICQIFGQSCKPCRDCAPKFVELAKKYNSQSVCTLVKEDASYGLTKVDAVPCFKFYVNGQEVHTIQGARMDEVEDTIKVILSRR